MSEAPEASAPAEASSEPSLPLPLFDRNLAPIRRIAAFATDHPDAVSYVEANTRRWLTPLLEADVPEPIRQSLIGLAGQIGGVDTLGVDERARRMANVRQELARLDAVLGLPLPRADRPRPERPRGGRRQEPERTSEPVEAREGGRRGKNRRRRGGDRADRNERVERDAPEPNESVLIEEPRRQPRRAFWNGNPNVGIADLDVPDDLANALEDAGILTVHDLLHHEPLSEQVFRPIHGAGRELPEGEVAVGGRLAGFHSRLRPDGHRTVQATLKGAARLPLRWTDAAAADRFASTVEVGQRVVVVGTYDGEVLADPDGVVEDGKVVRRVSYGLPGVPDSEVHQLVFKLLPGFGELRDPLPPELRPRDLPGHAEALLALHGRGDRDAARRRLAWEEAFGLALTASWDRHTKRTKGIQQAVMHRAPSIILSSIDHVLPDASEAAFDAIKRDLRRGRPMRRVLAGDAGSGRGLVALLAAASLAESKVQVLWVAPDEQLAEAHFAFAHDLLKAAGIEAAFLPAGRKVQAATA
ncbi:MAG: hypothetical protein KC656_18560, partial [Myxococcales bacterium]|nr:hypothetical protein [Myxococcales bacterium]